MQSRSRIVTRVLPTEIDVSDGIAYSLWLPDDRRTPRGGVVILHGAGSCKENHHDFARAALAAGFAALAFDQRGHGASEGRLDRHVLEDAASMTDLLRSHIGGAMPIALRGSSMGGYLALVAAQRAGARGVIAICPAGTEGLRRALRAGALRFDADSASLESFLAGHDLEHAVETLAIPVLLVHAEGDEQVPVQYSQELAQHLRSPESRLITVPGGDHRSAQHDPELQAASLRFLARAFAPEA